MPNPKSELAFNALGVRDPHRIRVIRLVAAGTGSPELLALSETSTGDNLLSLVPLEAPDRAATAPPLQSPLGVPAFDVAASSEPGRFHLVWPQPGSAFCPLRYRNAAGHELVLTGHYGNGVFMNPRFVKRDAAQPLAITAVAYGNSTRATVLFADALESGSATYRKLPRTPEGMIEQPLLLKVHSDYFLLLKVRSGPAEAARTDGTGGTVQAGRLYVIPVTESLQSGGPSAKPLGDTPIYEFDAAVSGNHVALLATTAAGITVATGAAAKFRIAWSSTIEAPVPVALLSPAIAFSASGAATIAALADLGTPQARVVTAVLSK